jgi:hypothetical protein
MNSVCLSFNMSPYSTSDISIIMMSPHIRRGFFFCVKKIKRNVTSFRIKHTNRNYFEKENYIQK